MADNTQDNTPQGNIRTNYNNATVGLNMDQSVNQIKPGTLTYALNAAVENFDASSVNYQNEQGNELCLTFPNNFVLIGTHFIQEKNKHIFFITNPISLDCQIGYMENNDCIYHILIDAPCLNFNVNHPIHKVVHKITNCTTEIYWTDGLNPRRYLDIGNIPYILIPNADLCDPAYTNEVDCNQLKLQPVFSIPSLTITDVITGGTLLAGTYQFAIQYSDASGNPYTSYYSVTNPTPIADIHVTTPNFNYEVGKSIRVNINNLDASGQFQYFNLAVIKTINNIPSVELIGTYFIDLVSKNITYTGQQQTQIKLTIADIFEKYPYYEIAQDLTAVQDILVWDNLTSIDRINYQNIASKVTLQWETYKLPANENYANELNATNLRGYLRDEVYAFEIVFLLKNGKQTDGFHIPGRTYSTYDNSFPDIEETNADFIGTPTYYVGTIGYSPYWKIYNTASVIGLATSDSNIENATPYEYGNFAYWESDETYPCNKDVWGTLSGQQIRHHKFPDVLVSPIFETPTYTITGTFQPVMQSDAVYPIGVKLDINQISSLITSSNLTEDQKADIAGFKIVRGDRGTNKSIIAKGILRNIGETKREGQSFYFPNYPYNDLGVDPFVNKNNNAWTLLCESFDVVIEFLNDDPTGGAPFAEIKYTDCNSNKTTPFKFYTIGTKQQCSISKPIILGPPTQTVTTPTIISGVSYDIRTTKSNYVAYSNYDEYRISSTGVCRGWRVEWFDYITARYENTWIGGWGSLAANRAYTVIVPADGPRPVCIEKCGHCGRHIDGPFKHRIESGCNKDNPVDPITTNENLKYRQIFNSPDTSFGQPFLGDVLKLESVMFGGGKAHFVEVKNNAKYRLLTEEAQRDALAASEVVGAMSVGFSATAMFTVYQAYLTIYVNGITRKNYAYSFNSIASYDYSVAIPNGQEVKQRPLDISLYLIPGVESVGDTLNVNNYERESSVYLRTIGSINNSVIPLPYPDKSPNMLDGSNNSIISDYSRFTISEALTCATPALEKEIKVVSYYASIKNVYNNQWGQIYSYDTIDTGFQRMVTPGNVLGSATVFGGDTFISRFAFKTKLPFFIDNRVNAPNDSDIFYDEIGNLAYPKYWHSARSILKNYAVQDTGVLSNIISYKAHNFDCPNDQLPGPPDINPNRTFYDGYFYLFAYGIPNFYCESSYNVDLRQAFNNKEGDFWPHVSTSIPDDWVQESFVPIAQDNSYYYNVTFSKQNKENTFTYLPPDWTQQLCFTYFPFRAIYSDPQVTNADVRVNNWLTYKPVSLYDFPQNYGALISLDGIQNKAVLARFENKSLMYNNLLTMNTSNPQAAYLGNPSLFAGAPPIDFAETDLGYVGSQNRMLLKIPQGQITVDAKRGQVFLIDGTQAVDLSAFGSGMNRFFTDHLAFEILRYFPTTQAMLNGQLITIPGVDTDNNLTGIGLHGVYDSKFDRMILTKLDYIPIDPDVKYDSVTKEFYVEYTSNDILFKTQVYLTDSEYFCNKSWTISFNFNTKTWVSFHSYIPNWYIAENNFFYSGINGCCTDIEGDFTMLVGENTGKFTPTSTTTSTSSTTTTTTTGKVLDCILEGIVITTDCILEGTGIITIPPTPTTTICQRPFTFNSYTFVTGYQINTDPIVDSTATIENACAAIAIYNGALPTFIPTLITANGNSLELGQTMYYDSNSITCDLVPDGWYYTDESANNEITYYILDGVIDEIGNCSCGTTTPTTTIISIVEECCGVLFSSGNNIYLSNIGNSDMVLLSVPGYIASLGIAMTATKFWSIDTDIKEWDITLSPFNAIYNRIITLPIGFTTSSGIVSKDITTLIAIDSSVSPQYVVELDITTLLASQTNIFTLQVDRIAQGNMLYTTGEKLLVINQDIMTFDYYITQYDYLTSTIELDLNIGLINATTIYECDCSITITDALNNSYIIDGISPHDLIEVPSLGIIFNSATQVGTCVPSSITDNGNITTTTTTTFVANTFCYTVDVIGDCTIAWIDNSGIEQSQVVSNTAINICAQLNSVNSLCDPGSGPVDITGGINLCISDLDCVPTTTTTTTL